MDWKNTRVLVTGGTGFLGGRLVERLIQEEGASVRVLVRSLAHASRIARFPLELVQGDVKDAGDVRKAAEGCDVIVHCAYGNSGDAAEQRRGTVGGTQHVLDAAREHGARRVVHVSTLSVYGETKDGDLDETADRKYSGDSYADSKLDAEKLALAYEGVPVCVLQPTIVYGPFGPAWTVRILNDLSAGRVILVDGGQGLCNAVYVDDVVSAMLLAAERDEAVGEAFLISGAEPVTWREFYGAYERVLGIDSTIELPFAEAEAFFHWYHRQRGFLKETIEILRDEDDVRGRLANTPGVRAIEKAAKAVLPARVRRSIGERLRFGNGQAATATEEDEPRTIHPMPPGVLRFHAAKTRVRIDKAERLLGYRPAFDFTSGMERTGAWARWANLT